MSDAYTTLWTRDRCQAAKRANQEGKPLALLLGGPHLSQRRERPIKHLDNGRITSAISLHGIYRLSEATAKLFDIQLAGALKLKQYQNNRGAS